MKDSGENYTLYLLLGLVMTLFITGSLGFYSFQETTRLDTAAEAFTLERIERGAQIYEAQCTACHGREGEGGTGPALNNRSLLKNTLDNVFFSVIRSGVPGTQMPAWSVDFGGPLTDEDVRDLVALMRSWEPTAPEIEPQVFTPDATRGARLFASTCEICHGENGTGTESAPRINDRERLSALPDEWYRNVIRNGRPAQGMPTWGTVLAPEQIEDVIALIAAWRAGEEVQPDFNTQVLLEGAIYALEQGDLASAALEIERAKTVTEGTTLEWLRNSETQIKAGDREGALKTVSALLEQWPLGDPTTGVVVYSTHCAACHGPQGEGGIGPALQENEFLQSQSNAETLQFLREGRSGTAMAGFVDRLNETQMADLIAFLRLWQTAP